MSPYAVKHLKKNHLLLLYIQNDWFGLEVLLIVSQTFACIKKYKKEKKWLATCFSKETLNLGLIKILSFLGKFRLWKCWEIFFPKHFWNFLFSCLTTENKFCFLNFIFLLFLYFIHCLAQNNWLCMPPYVILVSALLKKFWAGKLILWF